MTRAIHGRTNRTPALSWLLRILALVVVAIVAGRTSAAPSLLTTLTAVAPEAAVRSALSVGASYQWQDDSAPRDVDLYAVEAELDDDDIDGDGDARTDAADAPAAGFRGFAAPRVAQRAGRTDSQSDTSRFAVVRGFTRGPPARS